MVMNIFMKTLYAHIHVHVFINEMPCKFFLFIMYDDICMILLSHLVLKIKPNA
jgi:hypothetical protein